MKNTVIPEPFIRKGEVITAERHLNPLARAVARHVQQPGQFISSRLNIQAPVRPPGDAGTAKRNAIVRATADIPGGTGDPRAPALSGDYEHIKGDDFVGEQIENWSTVLITDGSYMYIDELSDGSLVIVSAYC